MLSDCFELSTTTRGMLNICYLYLSCYYKSEEVPTRGSEILTHKECSNPAVDESLLKILKR